MNPRDGDPLTPPDFGTQDMSNDLGRRVARGENPSYRVLFWVGRVLGVLLMALILFGFGVILGAGFSVGANLVNAASRPAPEQGATPPVILDVRGPQGRTGAPHMSPRVAPRSVADSGDDRPSDPLAGGPTAKPEPAPIGRHGTLSHMGSGYPADYLAIPLGPGVTVKLCGVRCGIYVSTDAGPARSMLVRGRIADASVSIFEYVCQAPASVGLCDARWTVVP